jgi:phage terminase large subunit-like protein
VLDDVPGALWTRAMLDALRMKADDKLPQLQRVVVGVDPSGTSGDSEGGNNEVGIVVAGKGVDGHGYVLADYTCDLSPEGWGRQVINAYKRHEADRVVAEINYGGAMVEAVLRSIDRKVSYRSVTASRGKGRARRTDCCAVRTGQGPPRRRAGGIGRPNVRLHQQRLRGRRVAGPWRRFGLGAYGSHANRKHLPH